MAALPGGGLFPVTEAWDNFTISARIADASLEVTVATF